MLTKGVWLTLLAVLLAACGAAPPPGAAPEAEPSPGAARPVVPDDLVARLSVLQTPQVQPVGGYPRSAVGSSSFAGMTCDEVAEWVGVPLLFLDPPPERAVEVMCTVENPHGPVLPELDQSGLDPERRYSFVVHVLYLPAGLESPLALDYEELLRRGAVNISVQFNGPRPPAQAPARDRPDEPAGGFVVVGFRGTRAVVQRIRPERSWVTWFEDSGRGVGKHVLTAYETPVDLYRLALGIRRGSPSAGFPERAPER